MSPVEATVPIRPQDHSTLSVDRGRGPRWTAVRGMGEIAGRSEVLGAEDASEEVVEAEEEGQLVNSLPTPNMPTQSERDEHDLTHYPYRSWCKHCVEGRGIEMRHRVGDDHSCRGVAIVAFDYMFMTENKVYTREELGGASDVDPGRVLKILVVRDLRSKALFAHAVAAKGADADGYAVDAVVKDVLWLGYSRVILKSDNEPAIVRLLRESLKALRVEGLDQAGEEHPPPYDPQANGGAEIRVKLVKGQLKTLRSSLEARVGFKIPVAHPINTWLVEHAADILTWISKGQDGKTAYHRVRGRAFNGKLLLFGETCRYKARAKESLENRDKWNQAIYLGRERDNGQHLLFDPLWDSVAMARTVLRFPKSENGGKMTSRPCA